MFNAQEFEETSEQKMYFLTFKLAFWTNKSAALQ